MISAKPVQLEERDVVAGVPGGGDVGEDLADDGAELVTVSGAGGGEDDVAVIGVTIDDEVFIGRIREEAGAEGHGWSGAGREIGFGEGSQEMFVVGGRIAVKVVRVSDFAEVAVAAEFEAGDAIDR